MSRIVESPKVDRDEKNLAQIAIVELDNLRAIDLPKINAIHSKEDKRLLRSAVSKLNTLGIFPTIELVGQLAGSEQQSHREKLLFVKTVSQGNENYKKDYYLTPEGDMVSFLRVGEQTELKEDITDTDYMMYTEDALLAIQRRILDGLKEQESPNLKVIK